MRKTFIITCLIIFQYSCSSDTTSSDESAPNNPTSANLIFPYQNSLCNEGTNVTTTESTVLFEWHASNNTDSYTLKLTNLSNGNESTHNTTSAQISIVLDRETPYKWYVISESNDVTATAQSESWQFYNAGEGNQNYAPFPAEIISPLMAESIITAANEITLEWFGNDVDDDIEGFDVYFGTSETPELYSNDIAESTLVVPITVNIYYWKIITRDTQGNTSNSGIYQFRIE